MEIIAMPLSMLMELCYNVLHDYTLAIILFTLLTKIILLPISLWTHKNGIAMVRMTPEINRLKIKYFGDKDTIAEETQALYKREKYHPIASTVPMIVQLVMLIGVINAVKAKNIPCVIAYNKSDLLKKIPSADENEIYENLLAMYERDTQHDIELGKTSHGPHHDELMIYVAKKGEGEEFANKAFEIPEENLSEYAARSFGSQGQQRSAVLSIKLAEGEIIKEKCGEYPVFLLDDLFSELDDKRRQKLSEMFLDKQCIITCCDRAALPKNEGMNIINVRDGRYYL